ncbi:MAG TPA: tetratricopeptide repeat protein [Terriglobales bacterium]
MTIEPFPIEIIPGAVAAPTIDAAAGAGVARLLASFLQRAGIGGDAALLQGRIWIADRWHAEIQLGDQRQAEEAAFDQGHHLLFRLAERTARWLGRELPQPVIHAFEDLRTASPAALLAYCAGWGSDSPQKSWTRAFELDPTFVAPRTALAQRILDDGGAAAHAAALLSGVAVEDAATAAALGLALWSQGELAAAQALLQQAVRNNADDAVAAAALAALLARSAPSDANLDIGPALDEALLLATRATQLASNDYRCWAALGDVYRARADFPQAGFYYSFALRLEPDAPTVLKDAGACWLMARQPQQALPLIEHALALAPDDPEIHGNLAFARHLQGQPDAALAAARRAAELAPTDARLRILHGDLAHHAGQREEALAAWARAAEIDPGITINPEGGNIGLPTAASA